MKCFKCGQGELKPIKKDGKSYVHCDECETLFSANDLRNYTAQKSQSSPTQKQERQSSNTGLKIGIISVSIFVLILIAAGVILALNNGLIGGNRLSDFTGTWRSEESGGSYQEAVITDGTIKINWVSDNGKTKSIYWIGTFVAPSEPVTEYSWTSKIDKDETDFALFSSGDDTKKFTYKNGVISYEVSALGTTAIMELKKE